MGIPHPPKPRTAQQDAARQFDFWLGEWDCSWGEEGRGTNSVYLDLGDAVVVESFDARPTMDYQGLSFSVYDRSAGCWKQTWVDTDANYLDFVGAYEDGEMDLRRRAEFEGGSALFRMRWHTIERNSLDWEYARSDDGGETWAPLWEIAYRRVL
ncbi:MAG: hypothetical protein H0W14_11510 [Actinobacteria bacterium]|nr:hypothetical protein [Actinomycetota bacterium]